jgi:malonyl-CoA/methylmalonyl-CoA synthetase
MRHHFLHDLRSQFAQRGNRAALLYRGRSYSYGELEAQVRGWAAWLQGRGVQPGDRVALATPNKFPFLIAHLGTLFAGAVSLPLNPRFTREEMRYFLADSGARVAVVGADNRALVEGLSAELPALQEVVDDAVVGEAGGGAFREPAPAAEDPALMIYSSGTTGWPKGVVHGHDNMGSGLRALQACWRLTPDDIVVNILPLFHIHGLCFATHLTLLTGGCVLLDDHFQPQHTLELVGRGTVFMAVPTIYYRFLEQPEFRAAVQSWTSVRLFTCGSAPIRPEVLAELHRILGRPVINRYGMSEAFVITSLPVEGPWPVGSVGLPLEGIEVRVDRADHSQAAPGEVGAVRLRGPNLFRGYWGQPEATQAAFVDGWFDTGDLGFRDAAGFLTLVGRKNDLIITKGYNVYPQVVERILNECPGVKESAVLGVPDPRRGERVVAVVVRGDPTLDERALHSFWEERLVDYQRPVDVVFVEALPRNAMGKVLRRELRDGILQGRSHGFPEQ